MQGLLIKDFYFIKKYCWYYIVPACIFAVASGFLGNIFAVYSCFLLALMPLSLLSYDERERWTQYSAALPYTRAQIVSAKYVIGLCIISTMALLIGAVQALTSRFSFSEMITNLAIGLVPTTIILPLTYKLGSEKTWLWMGACGGLIGVAFNPFRSVTVDGLANIAIRDALVISAAAAVLYAASWLLSVHWYKKREL